MKARTGQAIAFSPAVAGKLVGVNYNTVLYWVRVGLARASRPDKDNRQKPPVLFSFDNLLELKFIQVLRDKGASTGRIRRVLAYLRKTLKTNAMADLYLDVTSDDIHAYVTSKGILSAVKAHGQLLLINISRLRTEIEERARKQRVRLVA